MTVQFECLDYEGVPVSCDSDVWRGHILRTRPHMAGCEQDVQRAIAEPVWVYPDRTHHNRKAFYGILVEQWPPRLSYLKVVVRYGERDGQGHGWVVTAYTRRSIQEGGEPLWTR